MDKEASHENKILCEVNELLEKTDDSKNDEEVMCLDLNETWNDEELVILSEYSSDIIDVELDLSNPVPSTVESVVLQKKNDGHSFKVEENSTTAVAENEEMPSATEYNCKIEVNKKSEIPKEETDFMSEDARENSDNFHAKWKELRALSEKDCKYDFIRKRWGNFSTLDPSIDLTYRHRNKSSSGPIRARETNTKSKKGEPSMSCVSHVEKLANDVRADFCRQLQKLSHRHYLVLLNIQQEYQCKLLRSVSWNQTMAESLIVKRRTEEMLAINKYQRQNEDLIRRTFSTLAHYEKVSEEILAFHKEYNIGENHLLKSQQSLHLQETERMYKEYERFYS